MPAFRMSASTRSAAEQALGGASTDARSATSSGIASTLALRTRRRIAETAASARSGSRQARTTCAPARASCSLVK